MISYDILIVGGGQSGAQAAVALRQQGFEGSVAIVGEEPWLPYDRPPLSKEYLLGDKQFEQLLFRSGERWAELDIAILPGKRIVAVDAVEHSVTDDGGQKLGYGRLIWATGGSAKRLTCAGGDAAGVHVIRNRDDVDQLLIELPEVNRAVVIGGGYIGLEAAAAFAKLGKSVVLLEAQDRVLARVSGEPLSRFYEDEHRRQGVDIRLNTAMSCIETRDGRVAAVRLADDTRIEADMVVVGIGIQPEVEPLAAAGADCDNGVRVDEFCRTSLADIYAIGDCAEHRNAFADGAWVRIESVQNANDQAITAAKEICGKAEPYSAVPWFWSNQYDLRLQTVGLSVGYDQVVLRGDPASRSFSLVYLRDGCVAALDCVNMVRDYSHGKLLVMSKARVTPKQLADTSTPLKTFLSQS